MAESRTPPAQGELWVVGHAPYETGMCCPAGRDTPAPLSVCGAERCGNASSECLRELLNKSLIIFPLIIHLTEEQVE